MSVFLPTGRESFYCRVTVPLRLRPLVGRSEVWRSLRTADEDLARVRAEKWKAIGRRLFITLKRHGDRMNKSDIDRLVQDWLDEALDEDFPWHQHREEDLDIHSESLHESYLDNRWSRMNVEADHLLLSAGLPPMDHGSKMFSFLCRRLLEAHMEWTRVQKDRINGHYRPFNRSRVRPQEHFQERFQEPSKTGHSRPETRPASTTSQPAPSTAHTFMKTVDLYYIENVPRSTRSAAQNKDEFKRFCSVIGGDRPIDTITKDDCRKYTEHLLHDRKLRLVTVIKWIGMVGAIYRWASRQGFVPENYNPTNGLAPSMKRAKAEAQGYRDYTDEELVTVFSSAEFLRQRTKRPERYWSILLLLFTGARREEICQLNLCDVQEHDGIAFLNITDRGEGQALKNENSRRKVPLHSSLIELGFMDYVKTIRSKPNVTRLFPQMKLAAGQYGTATGHWYLRLLKNIKLGGKGLVLHGLRHTFITRLSDAGCNEKVRMTLVGHAAQGVHGRIYDHRNNIKMSVLKEGIELLRFPEVMKALEPSQRG